MPMNDEIGWLIEAQHGGPSPMWWDGSGYTPDSLLAVRFARKLDAERVILKAIAPGWVAGALPIATEHIWCATCT